MSIYIHSNHYIGIKFLLRFAFIHFYIMTL